ncbi:hypothetical protein EJB05_45784, partial [Eragrostis curvula]
MWFRQASQTEAHKVGYARLPSAQVGRPPKTARILNYVSRFLASMLIGSVIWLAKTCLMKLIASTFHRNTFFDRICESVFHQYVLQMLSSPLLMEHVGQESSGLARKDKEINSEWEAKAAAFAIFKNVARPGYKYIEEVDLLRFFNEEEMELVLPMFEGAYETGKIKKSAMRNWVVKAYLERKSLAHSLNDTKTIVMQLHNLISVIVVIIIIIITLLLMGIVTTKILLVISFQLLVVVFIFGNACKNVFEALIFVFIMHPFDVGDRCVIDGIQVVVEEMNILTTVFLMNDNEKTYYPNSVLSTKAISNFYRSPDMYETIDFAIDVSTSVESIGALKSRIKRYLESKPTYWHPIHTVNLKDILDVNKINMALCVQHTMSFQNIREKNIRRSELVMELKKMFEEMSIQYHLLPQKVELSYVDGSTR